MATLINIKTGQETYGTIPYFANIGDTVEDDKGNLYVIKDDHQYYNSNYIQTKFSTNKLTTVAVTFEEKSAKVYHYFVPYNIICSYQVGDKVKINTPFGVSNVKIVDTNINIFHSRATKLIDIIDAIPKETHRVARVVFYNDNKKRAKYGNRSYDYLIEPCSDEVFIDHEYIMQPNNAQVKVINIKQTSDTQGLIYKQFIAIDNEDLFRLAYIANANTSLAERVNTTTSVEEITNKKLEIVNKKMKEKTMNFNTNKLFKNLEFGKINTDAIKFSLNGLAFKMSDGSYATYDIDKKEATDVSAFVIDTDFIFAIPVAIKDIKKGDVIKHLDKFMIVEGIFAEDKTISVIDPLAAEEKVLIPVKNAFGFSYYTKIVNVFEGADFKPSEDTSFSNILPLMLMSEGNMNNSMLFAMMMMNKDENADFMKNPLMMMALINK